MYVYLLVLVLLFGSTQSIPTKWQSKYFEDKCGYDSCHPVKDGAINLHIVAHTHDDVGWLKTVDQYFYGHMNKIQNAGVQYIITTAVDSLLKNPDRRFIYVETAFFWKWWTKQNDEVKNKVIDLVNSGRLEFIGGGWSMNDEAATHYHSIVDNMAWGLRRLNDTFGECGRPKIGWQIDPFGHSKEMANIFAQLGFDGFLFGRLDFQDKDKRWKDKTAEMVWRGSKSLGESSDIFTGALYNQYQSVGGFNWDHNSDDYPWIDDEDSFENNVQARVDEFISKIEGHYSEVYTTSNILITMGGDFHFQNAETWFINLDKLITYVNQRQDKYHLLYSTPSCYVKAVYDESKDRTDWQLKEDDFFPYGSDSHSYWTGYFSSRPALKRYERLGNNFLQICKQLFANTQLDQDNESKLNYLRESMGVMQHHDAVSGTEKQHVAEDYARLLQRGIDNCENIAAEAIGKQATKSESEGTYRADPLPWATCPLTNVSQCSYSENLDSLVVTVYNPLSRPVTKLVKLPVVGNNYAISDEIGNDVSTQAVPIPDFVKNIPGRNVTQEPDNDLYFTVSDIPPLGWKSYIISKSSSVNAGASRKINPGKGKYNLKASGASFSIDSDSGLVSEINLNGVSIPLSQNFYYYKSFVGDNSADDKRSSGAYAFRNNGDIIQFTDKASYDIYEGDLIAEVQQKFNDYVSQTVRVNSVENYVEFDWVIGPLPLDDPDGVEVVTKYSSQLATDSTFYTDSNGKELLKRIKDFRPTWDLDSKEPVSANYYPITSRITVRDEDQKLELAVLNDRAQGGTSLNDGEIEIMIHRFCPHDDSFGVGEALKEQAFDTGLVVRGSHYVTTGSVDDQQDPSLAAIEKDIAQKKLLDSWVFLAPFVGTADDYRSNYNTQYAGLKSTLPDNVQILTLEPWGNSTLLLRLEHVFEKDEDSSLSEPVTVDLNDLFASFAIETITETTLGGNQWLADSNRLIFKTSSTSSNAPSKKYVADELDDLKVTLNASDIRTFIVQLKK